MNSLFDNTGIWRVEDEILLNADELDKAVSTLRKKFRHAPKIGIAADNYFNSKRVLDLDFLYDFPHITHFNLSCCVSKQSNLQAIYSLSRLEYLQWRSNASIHIESFPRLLRLSCIDEGNIGLVSQSVRDMYVCNSPNLDFLHTMPNLEKLELRNFQNASLNGIETLKHLNRLTIKSTRKLTDIQAIRHCGHLEHLEIETVPKIDWEALFHCPQIKELFLHQAIPTCKFLNQMPEIVSFVCKEIQDNDVLPIMQAHSLSYIYLYRYKRSYNVSKQEFQSRLNQLEKTG